MVRVELVKNFSSAAQKKRRHRRRLTYLHTLFIYATGPSYDSQFELVPIRRFWYDEPSHNPFTTKFTKITIRLHGYSEGEWGTWGDSPV